MRRNEWTTARRAIAVPFVVVVLAGSALAGCASSSSGSGATPATTAAPPSTAGTTTEAPRPSVAGPTLPGATPTTVTGRTALPPPTTAPNPGGPVVGRALRVTTGNPANPAVALTFDTGGDAGNTVQILDLLRDKGITASFGVTGAWARAYPELVKRMTDEGHHIMNMGDDHRSFTGAATGTVPLTAAERTQELIGADTAVVAAGGYNTTPYFRPPYGDVDDSVDIDVASAGFSTIALWSVDPGGWQGASTDDIVERSLAGAKNGAVYLFHVSGTHDADALPEIITGLQAKGLQIGSVPSLI